MKQKIILVAAVAAGLLAALLAQLWIASERRETDALRTALRGSAKKVTVVAAARPLPKGTVIMMSDLGTISIFETGLRGHVVLPDDYKRIIGRTLAQSLDENDAIFWSDIEGGKQGSTGLARDIQQGMRAVSVSVSGANAVSGMVRPNDTVDVLGSFMLEDTNVEDSTKLATFTMLQNVTVLATGSETSKTIADAKGNVSSYGTVTLEVTPREAEILVFAQQMKGRITLVLRNPSDVNYEDELPRVDFTKVESELRDLNEHRQKNLRGRLRNRK